MARAAPRRAPSTTLKSGAPPRRAHALRSTAKVRARMHRWRGAYGACVASSSRAFLAHIRRCCATVGRRIAQTRATTSGQQATSSTSPVPSWACRLWAWRTISSELSGRTCAQRAPSTSIWTQARHAQAQARAAGRGCNQPAPVFCCSLHPARFLPLPHSTPMQHTLSVSEPPPPL